MKEDLIKSQHVKDKEHRCIFKISFQSKANFCVENHFSHFNLFKIDFIEKAVNDAFFRFDFLISFDDRQPIINKS